MRVMRGKAGFPRGPGFFCGWEFRLVVARVGARLIVTTRFPRDLALGRNWRLLPRGHNSPGLH